MNTTTATTRLKVKQSSLKPKKISIFAFTRKHGGFFSTQREGGDIKATYNNGSRQPISATGVDFRSATENVMNLFYKLNA